MATFLIIAAVTLMAAVATDTDVVHLAADAVALSADDECADTDGSCSLNFLQHRAVVVKAQDSVKAEAEAEAELSGVGYTKKGVGGCSTPDTKFPKAKLSFLGLSHSACERKCTSTAWCTSYDYCVESNCDGNCWLFQRTDITGSFTNGYPGSSCYVRERNVQVSYVREGVGGCSTPHSKFPKAKQSLFGLSHSACRRKCTNTAWCTAYDHCVESNCDGNCWLFQRKDIRGANGYPGSSCFRKQR